MFQKDIAEYPIQSGKQPSRLKRKEDLNRSTNGDPHRKYYPWSEPGIKPVMPGIGLQQMPFETRLPPWAGKSMTHRKVVN